MVDFALVEVVLVAVQVFIEFRMKLFSVVDPVFVGLGVYVVVFTVALEVLGDSVGKVFEKFVGGARVVGGGFAEEELEGGMRGRHDRVGAFKLVLS